MTKERWIVVVSIMMCILGCVCFWLVQKNIHKEQQAKTEEKSIYKTLSEADKKAADIYAEGKGKYSLMRTNFFSSFRIPR